MSQAFFLQLDQGETQHDYGPEQVSSFTGSFEHDFSMSYQSTITQPSPVHAACFPSHFPSGDASPWYQTQEPVALSESPDFELLPHFDGPSLEGGAGPSSWGAVQGSIKDDCSSNVKREAPGQPETKSTECCSPQKSTGPSKKSLAHTWIQKSNITSSKTLSHLVLNFSNGGVKSFFCGWSGCQHLSGFAQKPQLITHILSTHLQEKPFLCTTCNTTFGRKQEAIRHVNGMNSGKQHRCRVCHRGFSRKHYRDSHEDCCVPEESSDMTDTQQPNDCLHSSSAVDNYQTPPVDS